MVDKQTQLFDHKAALQLNSFEQMVKSISDNYKCKAEFESKLLAYTSLCRPILEYADVVWDPHTKTNINKVEKIQDRAIRFISNLKRRKDSVSPPGRS